MNLSTSTWRRHRPLRCALVAICLAASLAPGRAADSAQAEAAHTYYSYTTQPGDTLIGLAQRLLAEPSAWAELAVVNGLRNPDHIAVGQVLQIPLRLMVVEPAPAMVTAVSGEVRDAANKPVLAGQALPEGAELRTGDGSASVRLVDGTVLLLRAGSQVQIETSNRVKQAGMVRSGVRVQQGQVEVRAKPAAAGQPGFRVGTPQGVLGVRGTEFRVHADSAASATRSEVLEGAVAATGIASAPAQLVLAGFGVVVDSSGAVTPPVRLLPAPDLSKLPVLQERPLMRFNLPDLAGASGYRGQVAADAGFEQLLADTRTASRELRIAGLPDGDYVLRVRAEDANGLQGLDAEHHFRLKARPEPPLPTSPVPRAVFSGDRVELAWAYNPQAESYRLQLAKSDDFSAPLQDLRGQTELTLALTGLPPGTYFWRLASERSSTDQGPFGAAQQFELRAVPAPLSPPKVGDQSIRLSWEGLPGQTFDLQFARDPSFATLVLERTVDAPSFEAGLADSGLYFVRLRARDPDGFLGPFTAPQQFTLPSCLRDRSGACVKVGEQLLLIQR